MKKCRRLFFRWILFLVCNLALAVAPAQDAGDRTRSLVTVQARKQALIELTVERERLRTIANIPSLVQTINQIGELHLKLFDLDSALADATESLALARQSHNDQLLVDTLNFFARVSLHRQENLTALRWLQEAKKLSVRLKYRQGEAQSLAEQGLAYQQLSDLPNAEACNDEALRIWRELQDKRGEARTLTIQGETYMLQDRAEQSKAALDSAVAIWRDVGDSAEFANTLLDLNFLAIREGQWQQALVPLSEAQQLVTDKEAEPYLAGAIATSFGEIYEAYGDLGTALTYYRDALKLYRDNAHDKSAAIDLISKTGRVQARIGDYAAAVKQIEEALRLEEEIDDELGVGLCHEDLGRVRLAAGSYQEARQEFLKAIDCYERTGNRRPWARAHTFLGQTEYLRGNLVSAASSYRKALQVFKTTRDYANEAALCAGLGKLELQQQNLKAAKEHLERSIALTEQLRENAASKDLRSSFLASVHDRYESYIEWLMELDAREPAKGFNTKAFEASELGRARSLLDSIKDHQRELRQVANPALLLDEARLQKEEQGLLDEQARLRTEGAPNERSEKLKKQLQEVRTQYETLEAQINTSSKFTDLLRASPKFAEIKSQVIDADTTLLEYSLGARQSYLWMITPQGIASFRLADKNTIEKAAQKLVALLAKPDPQDANEGELREAIAEVSSLVFGEAAGKLPPTRLVIVADGILQYVPFQILTVPANLDEPLIAKHEIVYAPSAATLALVQKEALGRTAAPKLLAALGDPVLPSNYRVKAAIANAPGAVGFQTGLLQRGSDDGVGETLDPNKLAPLYFAGEELADLRKLAPADQMVIYSDFDATRENLRNLDLHQYRILHFATHGLLNTKQPELSALVLSLVDRKGQPANGLIGLYDVYNLHAPVDLVVLSACSTGLGTDVRGEGLIGLTRGFMYAGASSVVASLWKVNDEATAELMKLFYNNMLQGGMTPAAALRAAQNSIRQQRQWRSPYYWAAFTLQGDYKHVIKLTPTDPVQSHRQMLVSGMAFLALLAIGIWWYRRHRAMRTRAIGQ